MGWTDDKAVGAEHDLRGRVLAVLSALPEGRCMDEQQVSAAVGGGRVGLVLQRLASERLVAPTLTGWYATGLRATGSGLDLDLRATCWGCWRATARAACWTSSRRWPSSRAWAWPTPRGTRGRPCRR